MSVFEIIICLVTGKALNSMWILINALQFIVFISIWLINMPNFAKLVFDQLKRILLGEFIEDLEFGKKIADNFGLETEDEEGLE